LVMGALVVASLATPVAVQHHINARLQEQEQTMRRQKERLTELRNANEQLAQLLAQANRLRAVPAGLFNDILRLRGQLGRLTREVRELTQQKTADSAAASDPLTTAGKLWSERATQLKKWLEANPAGKIPELQYLADGDWIEAIHPHTLDTDEDCRRAMGNVRANAELRVLHILHGALQQYGKANNWQFPSTLSQLTPYFRSPIDDAVLDRYEIVRANRLVGELQQGEEWAITQKAPIDAQWDSRQAIGMTNGSMADCRVTNRWALAP
jgi:hypothetical protein